MSNLRLISESTGSSITSFSMTDVFSSDFDIYKVVLDTIDFANADLFFRFIISKTLCWAFWYISKFTTHIKQPYTM